MFYPACRHRQQWVEHRSQEIAAKAIGLDTGLGCNLMDPHILKTLSRAVANALSSIPDRNNDNWPTNTLQNLGIPGGGGNPTYVG